jgi:hypothetical protein
MQITNDDNLKEILNTSKVIAVVGHSDKPFRTSYQIAEYMRNAGYKIYPVNPSVEEIDGQKSYASLEEVPEPIDIVNVFRRSEHLQGVVEAAAAVNAKAVWAQLGVSDPAAEQSAQDADLPIVMNRCIKIDHRRLQI